MISFLRTLSIFWKIFSAISMVVLAVVIFQLLYFPTRQINGLNAALRDKGEALVRLLSYQAGPAIDFGVSKTIVESFRGASRDPDFAFAIAFTDDAKRLAEYADERRLAELRVDRAIFERLLAPERLTDLKIETIGNVLLVYGSAISESGARGSVVLGLSTNRVQNEILAVQSATFLLGVVILAGAFLIAIILARFIATRLTVMSDVAEKVAHGDLSHPPLVVGAEDDIGRMAGAFNRMLISQRNLVKQINDTAVQLNGVAGEFSENARQQEQGAREQSSSLEEVSSSMSALSDTAHVIATNADSMSQVSEEMSTTVRLGQDALRIARSAIGEIAEQNDLIADRINKLYEKSQAIINVIDIIDDISDRLDLLALNAALEGSRVGDIGKGFSLVAQEMRRLAENVTGSTKEIKETIEEIHRFIQASLEASQQGTATSRQGVEEMAKMAESMGSIFGLIEQTTESARKITVSTQQQLSSTQQMVAAMGEVAAVSNQGLVSAQEVTRAAGDMSDLARRLRDQVSRFRIDGQGTQSTGSGKRG
jgi:methyl-accepting chemotaxis protein